MDVCGPLLLPVGHDCPARLLVKTTGIVRFTLLSSRFPHATDQRCQERSSKRKPALRYCFLWSGSVLGYTAPYGTNERRTIDKQPSTVHCMTLESAGPILGFISAFILFEVQQWGTRRRTAKFARQSLIAELKLLESLLSIIVLKCGVQSDIVPQAAREMRWLLDEGFERNLTDDLPAGVLGDKEKILKLSDRDLERFVQSFRHGNLAAELPIPVINSILAAPTSPTLSANEIKALIDVRWQSSLLHAETQVLNESMRLMFSVSDPENYKIARQNHLGSLRAYGRRASHMLTQVRLALKEIQSIKKGLSNPSQYIVDFWLKTHRITKN